MKKQVKVLDWSYIASFLDTEGSLGIYGKKTKQVLIRLTNTNKYSLEQMKVFLGFSAIYPQASKSRKKHWKKCWRLSIKKRENQIKFLEEVIPYLLIKKRKAIEVLKWLTEHRTLGQRQNPNERRKQGDLFKCSNCQKLLPKTEFWKNKSDRYGINAYCKDCSRKHQKRRRERYG